MSSSSVPSPTTTTAPSILSISINEKLTKSNYPLWRAQVLPAVRAARLEGLLTGDEQAPEEFIIITKDDKTTTKQRNPAYVSCAYVSWAACDQAVLGYLLSSLTRETLQHVSRSVTLAQAWKMLADLYSSQTRARSVNTCIALATTKKNHMTVSDYYAKMCQFVDDLAASGTPLHDNELVAYLLAGLDKDYNPIFTAVVACADPISPSELYAQLLSFEHHTHLQSQPSSASTAMAASRSRGHGSGGFSRGTGRGRGRGGRNSRGGRASGNNNNNSSSHPSCQICSKIGHGAKTCWYRYDEDSSEQHTAAAATSGADSACYTDSGASDHITGDLCLIIRSQ
jgi:uncharacterized membrane protein YgcG